MVSSYNIEEKTEEQPKKHENKTKEKTENKEIKLFSLTDYVNKYKFDKNRLLFTIPIFLLMLYAFLKDDLRLESIGWFLVIALLALKRTATNPFDFNFERLKILILPLIFFLVSIYSENFNNRFYIFILGIVTYLMGKLFLLINELKLYKLEQITGIVFIGLILLFKFGTLHPKKNEIALLLIFIGAWGLFFFDQSNSRPEEDLDKIHSILH
jgi:hypothetical protein